ncbi:MAG: type II toxin-antitoxin system antitoxin SocA domain-containing protein [Rickettsiales bacterium]
MFGVRIMSVRAEDVAQYILEKMGVLPAMKLQKLCYYAQAWSLVWDEQKLFDNRIEAWANGPVTTGLYASHYRQYEVAEIKDGDSSKLADFQKETIDKVINFYGGYTSKQLSDITHMEEPWKIARQGVPDGERSNNEITLESMANYYGRL